MATLNIRRRFGVRISAFWAGSQQVNSISSELHAVFAPASAEARCEGAASEPDEVPFGGCSSAAMVRSIRSCGKVPSTVEC